MLARTVIQKLAVSAKSSSGSRVRLLSSQASRTSSRTALASGLTSASRNANAHGNSITSTTTIAAAAAAAAALTLWASEECAADAQISQTLKVGLTVVDELYDDVDGCTRAELADAVSALSTAFPNNAHVLWRLARAQYELHEAAKTAPAPERKALLLQGLALAHDAVKSDDSVSAAHKWCGILLTSVGDYESTKVRIGNSYTIRDHFAKAAELDPTDPNAQHLLGRWCVAIAGISWIERKAASIVFGTPPTSSFEEALVYFEHAEKLKPNYWKKNQVMLGTCLEKVGRKAEAKVMYATAMGLATRTDEDKEAHKDAEAGVKRIG